MKWLLLLGIGSLYADLKIPSCDFAKLVLMSEPKATSKDKNREHLTRLLVFMLAYHQVKEFKK